MRFQKLYDRIIHDLELLNPVNTKFNLVLRPYSKTMEGYYNPSNHTIVIYVCKSKDCKSLYPYSELWGIVLHELAHHLQYSTTDYIRVKGVMHNKGFYSILNLLKLKSNILRIGEDNGR